MARQAVIRKKAHIEMHAKGSWLRDFILGWQDGLVNVLGVILGVATATKSFKMVIIAAMAAAFAESVSMAAVAYTSFKAEHDFYKAEVSRETCEMKEMPQKEKAEVKDIYSKLGFREPLLGRILKHVVSNKKRWLNVMMEQELRLYPPKESPVFTAAIVGISALIGSFIPVIPFIFLPVQAAIIPTLITASIVLFFVGVYKAISTIGNPIKSGLEMVAIGMMAALVGYAIGAIFGVMIT